MGIAIVTMGLCLWCRKPPPKPKVKHTIIDEPDYRQEEEERLTKDEVLKRELPDRDVCYTVIEKGYWTKFFAV